MPRAQVNVGNPDRAIAPYTRAFRFRVRNHN
jgi:hypothetical protein